MEIAHSLGDGASEHGERDEVAVERRLRGRGAVRRDEDEEPLEELRLGKREAVLKELYPSPSVTVNHESGSGGHTLKMAAVKNGVP